MGKPKKRAKGRKYYTKCKKCGIDIICWEMLEPICITCDWIRWVRRFRK